MHDAVASIGPRIRQLRQQKKMSLQQLAERSDVSAAAIHKIERNNMVPTITTLIRLATALNRSVAWFVSEDEHEDRAAALIRSRRASRQPRVVGSARLSASSADRVLPRPDSGTGQ